MKINKLKWILKSIFNNLQFSQRVTHFPYAFFSVPDGQLTHPSIVQC
jgi:hypothetical protein